MVHALLVGTISKVLLCTESVIDISKIRKQIFFVQEYFSQRLLQKVSIMFLASLAATNPLVYTAASSVAKKAFAAVAARSLKGISDIVVERYRGDAEVLRLRDELELKVRTLSLPIDICVQQAVRGNSALEGALDVALSVLRDIYEFEESLRGQDVAIGRGDSSTPSKESHTMARNKLQALIKQLDSLLPYLGVAISAVSLLGAGNRGISPSRLMAASYRVRSAVEQDNSEVLSLPIATWHQEGQLAKGSPIRPMQNQFPLCSVAVKRVAHSEGSLESTAESEPAVKTTAASFLYELAVVQNLDDGLYHEEEEEAGSITIGVQDILNIEWATSQSLKLGDNNFTPALVLHVLQQGNAHRKLALNNGSEFTPAATNKASTVTSALSSRSSLGRSGLQKSGGKHQGPTAKFALQIRQPPAPDSDADADEPSTTEAATDGVSGSAIKTPSSRKGSVMTGSKESSEENSFSAATSRASVDSKALLLHQPSQGPIRRRESMTTDWATLGELEYVLRLCMLEARLETPHYLVQDEQVEMGLLGSSEPQVASPDLAPRSRPASADLDSLSKNFERVGFGSPVG